MALGFKNTCCLGLFLTVMGQGFALLGAVVEHIGNRLAHMGAQAQQVGVVRQDQHTVVLPCLLQGLADGGNDAAVQILDGSDLLLRQTLVGHLVGGFQVDIGKIAAVTQQGIDGGLGFALPVGVDGAGGVLHLADLHIRAYGDALQQVYGGDHRALQAGLCLEGL